MILMMNKTKRILHVEDDRDTRDLVKILLENSGFEVISACNGKECFNILKNEKVDLVLLDIMLPDMSGWDIFQRIKKMSVNRPKVIFLSVIPTSEDRLKALKEEGVFDYINKPFDNKDLIERISRALEHVN